MAWVVSWPVKPTSPPIRLPRGSSTNGSSSTPSSNSRRRKESTNVTTTTTIIIITIIIISTILIIITLVTETRRRTTRSLLWWRFMSVSWWNRMSYFRCMMLIGCAASTFSIGVNKFCTLSYLCEVHAIWYNIVDLWVWCTNLPDYEKMLPLSVSILP